MRILALLIGFFNFTTAFAQSNFSAKYEPGENDRRLEFYFDMGWVVGPSETGAKLDYVISVDYTPGLRYKMKTSGNHTLMAELSYHNVHYHLHQEVAKLLPNSIQHDRERFYIHVLNLAPIYRYQGFLDSKGFIDLGFNFDWNFRKSHMIKNPDGSKTYDRSITYFEPINLDILGRVGYKRWSFHGIYRLTDLIKEESGLPGLPPTIVGIGLSL